MIALDDVTAFLSLFYIAASDDLIIIIIIGYMKVVFSC